MAVLSTVGVLSGYELDEADVDALPNFDTGPAGTEAGGLLWQPLSRAGTHTEPVVGQIWPR